MSSADKALSLLRHLPRLSLNNLANLPNTKRRASLRYRGPRVHHHGHTQGGHKGRMLWPALGYEAGNSPITETTPIEKSYNYGYHAIRQYPPMSLKWLQLQVDIGRLDPLQPVDLATICNTKVMEVDPARNHFGVNLTEEGADSFTAKVNLEVQWASEAAIAAIERNGGVITTAYFDIFSVTALTNPRRFFESGRPIPKRLLPPADCIGYYTDPRNRGYLADPREVAKDRLVLAQKYGYELPEIDLEAEGGLMGETKDPRQVFHGLSPGWVVSLTEGIIYKPVDQELEEYYVK